MEDGKNRESWLQDGESREQGVRRWQHQLLAEGRSVAGN